MEIYVGQSCERLQVVERDPDKRVKNFRTNRGDKTPYEVWTGLKPNLEHIKKLSKVLHGLYQAPRASYLKLRKCPESMGLSRYPYEHAVYTKRQGEEALIVVVYVNDLLVIGTSGDVIHDFKEKMNKHFEMSDLGKISYYLGIEVDQQKGYVELK
ncbi:hypothetical protein AgCh_027141 [Apium graveolens]